jgi:hypothetical protein
MTTNIQTLNLSNDDSGMVPLGPPQVLNEVKPEEKNMHNINKEPVMDAATPLDEVMGLGDLSNAPLAQDPRMVAPQQQAAAASVQMAQPVQQQAQPTPTMQSKNPLNLTDDQMEALIVGAVAVLAFSKPIQEKMAQMIPQFLNENGGRSNVGIILSGLVAALIYFFGRRFIVRN